MKIATIIVLFFLPTILLAQSCTRKTEIKNTIEALEEESELVNDQCNDEKKIKRVEYQSKLEELRARHKIEIKALTKEYEIWM